MRRLTLAAPGPDYDGRGVLPGEWPAACATRADERFGAFAHVENITMAEPILKQGSSGPDVRDLQQALKALGHDPGPIDGAFGARTVSAVKAFQQAREIAVDGIVGRVTWINIDEADQSVPVLRVGSSGLPVRRLQSRMSAVGFDTGGVDGRFSPKTEAAVKQLQQQSHLAVDGIVGPKTWAVVDALENEGGAS